MDGNWLSADRLLAAIVQNSDDAIISKSLDGIIRSWNASAHRIFGHTAEQAIGQHISLIIPATRMAEEDRIIAALRAGERVEHFETERVRRDGSVIPVSLTISPINDEQGNIIGASKIARDISERRAIEKELAQADRTKDRFIATLSHELRNPLAPIRAAAQLIRQRAADVPDIRNSSNIIERQLQHMVRLLEDLLDISRITANKVVLDRTPEALRPIIQSAVELSGALIESAGHKLSIQLPDEVVYLECDPVRIAQVISNLLNNAAKYMVRGGRIDLRAQRHGGWIEISVKDQGIGIASHMLPKVFQMYWQAAPESERRQVGLGIGLALSRAIVELHGGTIAARSDGERKGSEFIVRLPVLKTHSTAEAPPAAAASAPVAHQNIARRVLIVDDLQDSADSLAELLRALGHETHTAYDGIKAIELADALRPEVMILDVGMPGMSGNDVCRNVRQLPAGRDIYMIALTGWGQASDRLETSQSGFDLHLVKPVDGYLLAQRLTTLGGQG